MLLRADPYTLTLKHRFSLASGSRTTTPCVLLEVNAGGFTGYGEASMPPYLGETQEGAMGFLASVESLLPQDPARLPPEGTEGLKSLLAAIDQSAPAHYAAKAAVDIALHDWLGKALGRPLHRLWGISPDAMPLTSYTIGIGDDDFVSARVKEAEAFRILKVKLGGGNDRNTIDSIRRATGRPLRVDVNQGWHDREEAARMVEWLSGQGVELVEQPFAKERADDTAWLRERSPIPLVADESAVRLPDLERIAGVFDGVNIKLMKCTGLAEARSMIARARSLGLRIMLGCMTETSCGIAAAAQLAPLADWADLDGALLISNDPFEGATVRDGRVTMPEGDGIGVRKKGRE